MFSTLKKIAVPLTVVALIAVAGPATAGAKTVKYKGKTSSGHNITFDVKNGRIHDLAAGVRASCVSIQGGGAPLGGVELFGFNEGSIPLKAHNRFSFMAKPAFHYNEVTMNHDLWLKRKAGGVLSGRMRLQYSFLIPKYPIGTFTIYSCLAGATFKARPVR